MAYFTYMNVVILCLIIPTIFGQVTGEFFLILPLIFLLSVIEITIMTAMFS